MTTRKKKRQDSGGGFLKKVSSLFNLDTVKTPHLTSVNDNIFIYMEYGSARVVCDGGGTANSPLTRLINGKITHF